MLSAPDVPKIVSPAAYLGEGLLNPILLAGLGALVGGDATLFATVCVLKILVDAATARTLRGAALPVWVLPLVPAKDLLIGLTWAIGFFRNTVDWRGNRLRVLPGTRLVPQRTAQGGVDWATPTSVQSTSANVR